MKSIVLAALCSLGAAVANAAVLDYRFTASFESATLEGTLSSVADSAASVTTITGRLTLDPTPDPVATNPAANAFAPASITLDQVVLGLGGALVLPQSPFFVTNDSALGDLLGIGVEGGTFAQLPSDGVVESVGILLRDGTGTALSSNAFPSLIQLQDFPDATLFIRGTSRSGGVTLAQEVARFTLTELAPVPLPAALPMLLAGLGGLALVRRRTG